MGVLFFPVFLLTCVTAVVLKTRRPRWTRGLFGFALLLAAIPYLDHVRYVLGYARASTPMGTDTTTIGMPYLTSTLMLVLVLVTVSWAVLRRAPVLVATMPAALWLGYWYGCLPRLWRAFPELVFDNVPHVWLFASSAFSVLMLLGTAVTARGALKPLRHRRQNQRPTD